MKSRCFQLQGQSRPRRRSALAAALALAIFTVAQASAQFNGPPSTSVPELNRPTQLTTDQAVLYPPVNEQVLALGDQLTIHLFGEGEYSPVVRIGTNGTALLPLIGVVKLSGLTITQAEELIAAKLVEARMYKEPQVTIQITEGPNAVVTIMGEAHGVIPVTSPRRLLDVLSSAGGLPATASHVITISRPGVAEPIVVDLGSDPLHSALANIPVFAGDTIIVARIGLIYVVGAFKVSGTIPLSTYSPLTLMEATSLAGGTTPDGEMGNLRLIRTIGNQRTVAKLDINRVMRGKDPDPVLQPNDILFLPSNWLKGVLINGGVGAVLGAASIAISIARP